MSIRDAPPPSRSFCGEREHYFTCDLRPDHEGRHESHDLPGSLLHHWGNPSKQLLEKRCSLCHVILSTGDCSHLLDLEDGRVAMSRKVWNDLVADHNRLGRILSFFEELGE